MATTTPTYDDVGEESRQQQLDTQTPSADALSTYLGLSFSLFLASLPNNAINLVPRFHARIKELSLRIEQAEEQLWQMRSRRKEDSKANARVVEIFAGHRNAWQEEERRLARQAEEAEGEAAQLKGRMEDLEREWRDRVEDLQREVAERDEVIGYLSRREEDEVGEGNDEAEEEEASVGIGEMGYGYDNGEELGPGSKFWAEKSSVWQDVQYQSLQTLYHTKHHIPRRESPWKVDCASSSIFSKLKFLEQELVNFENVISGDYSKVPTLIKKQFKRYQSLAGKIDDLCQRMQATDPCDPRLSLEMRTQRQTEFLLEAFRLQQWASETAQKLMALQTEIGKGYRHVELGQQATITTRRSLDSTRNDFRDLQRNLEVWLARIIGDLEGILARDGASRVREYYVSRHPFVQ
ncbi:hypothetical protein MLD38_022436 [Melastoma candidum]|uniref:Uncharacterized protein n=1 Tax=Melastoma candidum TaxID=119954 RepID=A0ACB9QMM4_9MYRT|nr:hypothetical protein MLD38_022436 [Melastoma candidum]